MTTTTTPQMNLFTNPVSLTLDTLPSFTEKLVKYADQSGWSTQRDGFIMRRTPQSDTEFPNHLIVISQDEGYVRIVPLDTIQIWGVSEELPKQVHYSLSLLAYEKRSLTMAYRLAQENLVTKNRELEGWEEKVAKACEEADRRGYCSEFENIAEAAGFEVPPLEEFDVSCTVTITVTVSKEARTLERAKELVEFDDISNAISGEDSIEDWHVD